MVVATQELFEPSHKPELSLVQDGLGNAALEHTVNVVPDVGAMLMDEFKAYVHGLSLAGSEEQAVMDALLDVGESLTDSNHQLSHEMAELTVRLSELHQQVNSIYEKKRWVTGYIDDRAS